MSDFVIIDDNKKSQYSNTNTHGKKGIFEKVNDFLYSLQQVKAKEKVVFYRLLATMTNSGMGLVKSVTVLEKQENNKLFKTILKRIIKDLSGGKSLSDSMEMYPYTFSEAEIGMVRAGEKTGKLNQTLLELANQIEKVASISGKLKSAMIYPLFILLVVFGVIFLLMTMVVPQLLDIFGDKDSLPDSTKTLMAVSDFFSNFWYLIILFIIIFTIFMIIWKRTTDGKYRFDSIMLKIPLFGERVVKKIVLSKFARVLSGLISSGISIVEALKITADAVGNERYKQRILLLAEDVSGGIKIYESLEGDVLFPDMMIQMIQVGEETSKIDETVAKVADFYDEEVDNTIGTINKLLEPTIIIVLALIVGLIALGIIEPIMGIADSVSQA